MLAMQSRFGPCGLRGLVPCGLKKSLTNKKQMVSLDKTQASILRYLFDKLPIGESVETLEFQLSGTFSGRFYAAFADLTAPSAGYVVFTLPTRGFHVFLGLTREKHREVARILANLEDYERDNRVELKFGEVVMTPEEASRHSGSPFAVILLRTATALDISAVPDRTRIGRDTISFFSAVPITKAEYEYRKDAGHDALLDRFQSKGKQLFFF